MKKLVMICFFAFFALPSFGQSFIPTSYQAGACAYAYAEQIGDEPFVVVSDVGQDLNAKLFIDTPRVTGVLGSNGTVHPIFDPGLYPVSNEVMTTTLLTLRCVSIVDAIADPFTDVVLLIAEAALDNRPGILQERFSLGGVTAWTAAINGDSGIKRALAELEVTVTPLSGQGASSQAQVEITNEDQTWVFRNTSGQWQQVGFARS